MKKKFLIIQLFSNGDCLYATVLARQLKNDFPGCHVTWAVAPFCASILDNNPFIDELWQVDYITDRRIETFRKNKKQLFAEAVQKQFDEIFFTQIIEDNFVFYDGQVRSSIFSAFKRPVSVPVEPVLELTDSEKEKVQNFISQHKIEPGDFVILFECSPQSGQLSMDLTRALKIAERIVENNPQARVILSSQNPAEVTNNSIIDGSVLSLRETAWLTHFCHLLIGCSSGITWVGTSSAARALPSIQLLNRKAYIFNSPTLDHARNKLPTERWLELYDFDDDLVLSCVNSIIKNGFEEARQQFGQLPSPSFKLYRGIVHQFIQRGKFGLLTKFISRNYKLYGVNGRMIKYISLGVFLFPAQYLLNLFKKKK